jgi:hypothetical protein
MRLAASRAEGAHLVVKRLPVPSQDVAAGDHDVDLGAPAFDALLDLRDACRRKGESPAGKPVETAATGCPSPAAPSPPARSCRDRRRPHRPSDPAAPSASSISARTGLARLGAEAAHAAGRVVARQRGQVDQRDRAGEPGGLIGLLDRAPSRQGRRAAFDGRACWPAPARPSRGRAACPAFRASCSCGSWSLCLGHVKRLGRCLRLGHQVALFGESSTRSVSRAGRLWQA